MQELNGQPRPGRIKRNLGKRSRDNDVPELHGVSYTLKAKTKPEPKPRKAKPVAVGRVGHAESDGVDGEPVAAKGRPGNIGDGDDGWKDLLDGPAAYATAAQKQKAKKEYAAWKEQQDQGGDEPDDGPEPEEPPGYAGYVDEAGYDEMAADLPEDEEDDDRPVYLEPTPRPDSGTADEGKRQWKWNRPNVPRIDHPFWRAVQWTPARELLSKRWLTALRPATYGPKQRRQHFVPPDLQLVLYHPWVTRVLTGLPARTRLPTTNVLEVMAYWQGMGPKGIRGQISRHGHFYVAKTREQLAEDCGLSDQQTRDAVERLRKLGVLLSLQAMALGGKTTLYRLDWQRAYELWREHDGYDRRLLSEHEMLTYGSIDQAGDEMVAMTVTEARARAKELYQE